MTAPQEERTTAAPSLAEEVAAAVRRGWALVPLAGKKPVQDKWTSAPKVDAGQALRWARRGNIGVRTGHVSGIFVVDVDGGTYDGPPTPTAVTGKGQHRYYEMPDADLGNSAGKLGVGIDTRGDGGQVVLPGSIHPDTGTAYRWAEGLSPEDVPLAELPQRDLDVLLGKTAPRRVAEPAPRSHRRHEGYAGAALDRECEAVANAREGERNETLNTAAYNLGQLVGSDVLSRADVEEALHAAATAAGLELLEIVGTMRSGLDAGILNPRHVPERPGRSRTASKASPEVEIEAKPESSWTWGKASFAEMVRSEPRPIPWAINGVIARGEMGVVTADPKMGKTAILQQLAIDAGLGRLGWGLVPIAEPLRVLWIDEEMGAGKLHRRWQRMAADLTNEEVAQVDENLDIRPQQGLSLGDPTHLDAVRRAIDKHRPDVIFLDSLIALTSGDENSSTDRRRFYREILIPLKTDYDCAIIAAAHPPLASKDAPPTSQRRPRGSGDIIAQVDRSFWMHSKTEDKGPDHHVVTAVFESFVSRESGDLDPTLITIAGTIDQPLTITADPVGSAAGMDQIGKAFACQTALLHKLRAAADGELYQPDAKVLMDIAGFNHEVFRHALAGLQGVVRVDAPRRGTGRSGKWLVLIDEEDTP